MSLACSDRPADVPCCRFHFQQRAVDMIATATWPHPLFVLLIFDDHGLLVATRDHAEVVLEELADSCALVVQLCRPVGPAGVVLVSIDPGFGTDASSPAVRQAFLDASRRLRRAGTELADWWLIGDGSRESVAAACNGL